LLTQAVEPAAGFILLAASLEAATLLVGLGRDATPFVLVLIPPAAALIVTGLSGGQGEVKSLLGRSVMAIGAGWYVAANRHPTGR
jgi:hypothetical protein